LGSTVVAPANGSPDDGVEWVLVALGVDGVLWVVVPTVVVTTVGVIGWVDDGGVGATGVGDADVLGDWVVSPDADSGLGETTMVGRLRLGSPPLPVVSGAAGVVASVAGGLTVEEEAPLVPATALPPTVEAQPASNTAAAPIQSTVRSRIIVVIAFSRVRRPRTRP
jgi:hypothetical protein